jgi:hypothetical protein
MNRTRVEQLNAAYPRANFNGQVKIAPGTQSLRSSTGIELQVLLPVVQAPFRIYWAYNPLRVDENLHPPIVADRSMFRIIRRSSTRLQASAASTRFSNGPARFALQLDVRSEARLTQASVGSLRSSCPWGDQDFNSSDIVFTWYRRYSHYTPVSF